ncbi:helix-turn-helix transcriptional regulator [Kribbella sp. CA-293567]|uniref:helix-turn-helix transcriptional regulator n=1 Tax=Kribbella sp. CA-293567 TaxID=3002436 RepID=UPI0022DE955D|nr:LuxR family transcriptional regulator [Kribbella sp. CA-293567]WBQ05077.1 AAA family ATPase [Kribbella sp. CA-293567]
MSSTLERPGELGRIAAALDAAKEGEGKVVVIEGEAGIGKTRLVDEARALAKERGFVRMQATGDELESAMAWSVVRQMVERSISRYSGAIREAILAGPSGRALEALDKATPDAGDAEVARTMHALWWVAVDLASPRPLLITVDDAQWSDLPSLRFLSYLSKRVGDLPIALIVATRPPTDRHGPLAELSVSRQVERLLPRPLSREGIAHLTSDRAAAVGDPNGTWGTVPAEPVVDAVLAASGGNPFLAESLLDELRAQDRSVADPATAEAVAGLGSSTVSRTMLGRLDPDALQLAGALAILGARADVWLAGSVAQLPEETLPKAVQALVSANIVASGADQLSFIHPVIRESMRSALGPFEKAALHARAAEVLAAEHASADRIAAHLVNAPTGTLPNATEILRRAATASLAAGDPGTAAGYLHRAFEGNPTDAGVQAQLGHTLLRSGDAAAAREHLRAAARATGVQGRAALLGAAATATATLDGPLAAVAELTETLDGWPNGPERLTLEARLGIIRSYLPSERKKASEHLRGFAELPGDTPDERALLALLAQCGRYEVSPSADVRRTAERALRNGALFTDTAGQSDTLVGWLLAMMSLIAADGVGPAREEIARAQEWVRRNGSPLEFCMVSNVEDFLAWRCGDIAAMEADADAVLAAVASEELSPQVIALRVTAVNFGAYAALDRGDLATAVALLADFDEQTAGTPRVIPAMWLHEVRARIALEQDDPVAALEHAYRLRDEMAAAQVDPPAVPWRTPAAWALLRLGSEESVAEARELASDQLDLARRWGAASDLGAALRLTAKVDVGQGARRVTTLEEAVVVLEGSPARLELAKALVDLGEAYRVLGRRTDAREALARGGELAASCGSTVVRQRAAEALQALGDRPRTLTSSGQDSLTASERRVAGLAVSGRTNRDIAHELFVSPKTVENHLGRIYVKLGITGRRELARALT